MTDNIITLSELWFPSWKILYYGEKALKNNLSSIERKQVQELMSAAIMVTGINKVSNYTYRLQGVDSLERTPDVRTMCLTKEPTGYNMLHVQEIEIVTLGSHSNEDVDDFLISKKLPPHKAYPPSTIILCSINKQFCANKSWAQIHASISTANVPNEIYVIARVDPKRQIYQLVKVNPDLELIEYDVIEELTGRGDEGTLQLKRGSSTHFVSSRERINPFQNYV